MAKRKDEEESLISLAAARAAICGHCGTTLGAKEPVVVLFDMGFRYPICEECGAGYLTLPAATGTIVHRFRCIGCYRPIHILKWDKKKLTLTEQVCCLACRSTVYNERRRVVIRTRKCVVCKREFTPSRRDKRVCTDKCRERRKYLMKRKRPRKPDFATPVAVSDLTVALNDDGSV
jgi:hypothetical protein